VWIVGSDQQHVGRAFGVHFYLAPSFTRFRREGAIPGLKVELSEYAAINVPSLRWRSYVERHASVALARGEVNAV
jgi:hypothetical protein